jgi:hypothetical protein
VPKDTCSIEGCEEPYLARGRCSKHYQRWRRGADSAKPTCNIEGCEDAAVSRGWCGAHYQRWGKHGDPLGGEPPRPRGTIAERFWPKVNKDGPVPEYASHLGPCWLWTAKLSNGGYGQFNVGNIKLRYAHCVAYELLIGPILEGLDLDHLCRVRHCVNPAHLEPVTRRENCRRGEVGQYNVRKTHCPRGHPYDETNTYRDKNGKRYCRACWPLRGLGT